MAHDVARRCRRVRSYAKVYVSIWADEDFKRLSPAAQALYFRLLTDPKLSMCGVADWRPNRLALASKGSTAASIRKVAEELQAARFIVADDDSEEVLVRSFVRHDGVLKSPNLVKAMVTDWLAVSSSRIKDAVVAEVARATPAEQTEKGIAEVPGWFVSSSSDTDAEPIGNPSDSVPDEVPGSSPILHPSSSNLHPRAKAATQLPEDWKPNDTHRAYATEHDLDLTHQVEQFTNHHLAKGSTFKDWDRAFRTWLGNAKSWARPVQEAPRQLVPYYGELPMADPNSW